MRIRGNPYVGPRTYRETEGDRFFGRQREARDLLSLVISERLVLFYAQSGAGKSSLINARLRPWLVREGFFLLPTGRISGDLPEDTRDVDNIFAFNLLLKLDQKPTGRPGRFCQMTLTDFLKHLTTIDGKSYYYDQTVVPAIGESGHASPPHVLIIDQFEEILTQHLERWQDREEFFRQLNQAIIDDPRLWVVLSLREDYVAALDPYAPLMAGRLKDRFYMQRLEYGAALEAVCGPAELAGRPFVPGVAEKLVDNLRQIQAYGRHGTQPGQFIEPVQLQIVCYQLWQKAQQSQARRITDAILADYDVDGALTQFYEAAIRKTASKVGETETTLRQWVQKNLITEGGTRGTLYRGPRQSGGIATAAADLLVSEFLLRTEQRAAGAWYELVHDRFVEPIKKSNEAWERARIQATIPRADFADMEIRILERTKRGYPVEITLDGERQFSRGYLASAELLRVPSVSPQVDGERLFNCLFGDSQLKVAWNQARVLYPQFRIRLRIDAEAPELHSVPWELLRDPGAGLRPPQDLAASPASPFSRYLAGPWQPGGPIAIRPVRLLVAISSPGNMGKYAQATADWKAEFAGIRESLSGLPVEAKLVPPPVTLPSLESELRQGYHILHLVVHGGFDPGSGRAVLYLADEDNRVQRVDDRDFAELVARVLAAQSQSLRLVVLTTAQTANRGVTETFGVIGPRLIHAGVPAVLAQQDQLPVTSLGQFTHVFYHRLFEHGLADLAANEARTIFIEAQLPGLAMPILYSRLRDSRILVPAESDTVALIELQPWEPETLFIPAGSFLMGNNPGVEVDNNETPQHAVKLPAYRIGRYPVTNDQYAEFVSRTRRTVPPEAGWRMNRPSPDKLSHPVVGVSWYDALAYCQWLSSVTGRRYGLPTEGQWEKAARGTDGRIYPWGNEWKPGLCHHGADSTAPVEAYPPQSQFGCCDMVGNAREWTRTLWGKNPQESAYNYPWVDNDGRNDLQVEGSVYRVTRGGSALDKITKLRCGTRLAAEAEKHDQWQGFRVAMELDS